MKSSSPSSNKIPELKLKGQALRNFLIKVKNTSDEDISCEDAYQILDEYIERLHNGENVEVLMPGIHHHLEKCKNCFEEVETILEMVKYSSK